MGEEIRESRVPCYLWTGWIKNSQQNHIGCPQRGRRNPPLCPFGNRNYNDSTAKLYTDMGMFTSKTRYGEDATAVFNMLSGYSEPLVWNKLSLAPGWLRGKFLSLIEREKEHAKNGSPGKNYRKDEFLV